MTKRIDALSLNILSLLIVIFSEGFVSISVEILTIRQLVPVVGNSVIVTSLIIGVFLLFLALGYYRGSFYKDNYANILRSNFGIAAVILGIGISYLFIIFLFHFLEKFLLSNTLGQLTIYLLLVTAPLIYILGQTVPITTNLFRFERHIGSVSGKALFVSTLGSFLGSMVTALVFMNYFGVAWTVMINYVALFFIMLLTIEDFMKRSWQIALMSFLGVIVYLINVQLEEENFVLTNSYNNYQILKHASAEFREGKMLISNESGSSFLDDKKKAFRYIEIIKKIIFDDLKLRDKSILVVGAGGFSLTAERTERNYFIYNDIDKAIKDVALSGFIEKIEGEFIAEDARKFLQQTHKKFDIVISDAYSNRNTIPFHLLTIQHMRNIRKVLNPDGVAIFNMIIRPTLESTYSKRIDNTIRAVFPNCVVIPSHYKNALDNLLYVCRKSKYEQDLTVYTDNKNSADLDINAR